MNESTTRSPSTQLPATVAAPQPGATRPEQGPDCGTAASAAPAAAGAADPRGRPRLRSADRQQLLPPIPLDQLIEPDHPARSVWRFVEQLDLSVLYDPIRSREHTPGNPATDPRILVALWLYAIFYGVISARRVEELSTNHNAFRWLRGGVPLNHHLLSDLLVGHLEFLKQLFHHSVSELQQQGLVDLERVGQDGMRVRASAGAASFRRLATLEALLQQAQRALQERAEELAGQAEQEASEAAPQQEVAAEQAEPAGDAPEPSARQRGARRRAAQQRVERAQQALDRLPELQARKQPGDKEARASTTDPDATVMKMADGGYRPAYHFQYSTDTASLVIVGVDVVMVGSDQGQWPPMLEQIEESFGKRPHEALVDGGFVNHADIEAVQAGGAGKPGCVVYAPVPKPKQEGRDRYAPPAGDSQQVAEWRERMGTEEAKTVYKERAASAELVNAQARSRGLTRLLVRGVDKVRAIAWWFATVPNMARGFVLLPAQPMATDLSATPAI